MLCKRLFINFSWSINPFNSEPLLGVFKKIIKNFLVNSFLVNAF